MAKRYYSQGNYSGREARDAQERADSGMISEDKSAMANLPQNVVMKYYAAEPYASYDLNDTIKVVDNQMRDDMKEKKKGPMPEKY